jgi:hypothetical protein
LPSSHHNDSTVQQQHGVATAQYAAKLKPTWVEGSVDEEVAHHIDNRVEQQTRE